MHFAVLADRRVKLKKSIKRDKYLDLARELKNFWKVKVSAFGTVTKGLVWRLADLEKKKARRDHPNC